MPRKTKEPKPFPEPPGQMQFDLSDTPTVTRPLAVAALPDGNAFAAPPAAEVLASSATVGTTAAEPAISAPAKAGRKVKEKGHAAKPPRPPSSLRVQQHRSHRRSTGWVRVEIELPRASKKALGVMAKQAKTSARKLGGKIVAAATAGTTP